MIFFYVFGVKWILDGGFVVNKLVFYVNLMCKICWCDKNLIILVIENVYNYIRFEIKFYIIRNNVWWNYIDC